MSMQTGLSFEQAPPFALPLRFFLTAPLFLLAAAGLIMLAPTALASRWTLSALALTHALTLGFLAMAMLGALLQMLPVVAGAALPASRGVAGSTHFLLVAGTMALMTGFLGADARALSGAMLLLGCGFAVFLVRNGDRPAGARCQRHGDRHAARRDQPRLTLLLGMALASMRAGGWTPAKDEIFIAAHVGFGLLGWVLLLVIGVAYQVVPMFQITPPYPPRLMSWLAGTILALLLLHAIAPLLPAATEITLVAESGLAAGVLVFALVTLRLQSRRRRKLPDVTLDFWRVGMASLIASTAVWLLARLWPAWAGSDAYPLLLGVLFIAGFAVSVVCGMLYKIVPFLAWFHLQAQLQARAGSIPTMKDMIAERAKRWQFRLHLGACMLLLAAPFWPKLLAVPAGIGLALSAVLLELNLLSAVRRFSRHGGRFS